MLHVYIPFILASLTLNLLPGPDMIYIMARTISHGQRAGMLSVFGISTGLLFHTMAAASGLSLILLSSFTFFQIIKYIGVIYLIYLGLRLVFFTSSLHLHKSDFSAISSKKIYQQGFLTNILNPKVAIFFLAFLPQFVQQNNNTFIQVVILGVLFIITGTLVNTFVVLFCSTFKKYLVTNELGQKLLQKITGMVLIGIGLKIATYRYESL